MNGYKNNSIKITVTDGRVLCDNTGFVSIL
jgi:hypothetical protein